MTGRWRRWASSRKRLLTGCGAAGLLITVVCISAAVMHREPTPRLLLPHSPRHLGEGSPGETIRGEFRITNGGRRPLEFALTPGCGCAHLAPNRGTIPPGSIETIHVGIKLGSTVGDAKSVNIHVASNDPVRPETRFVVLAECPAPFRVSPRSVDFGVCPTNAEKSIDITVRQPNGTAIVDAERVVATVDSPEFRVEKTTTSDKGLVIRVSLVPQEARAVLTSRLTLADLSNAHLPPMTVPLRANVAHEFMVVPTSLSVAAVGRSPQRVIVWRADGRPLDGKPEIQKPGWLSIQDVSHTHRIRRVFEATLEANSPKQTSDEDAIVLVFPNTAKPVRIALIIDSGGS